MGGDKKPSAEFFQSGHGKTVLAEAFLSDERSAASCARRPTTSRRCPGRAPTALSRAACSRSRSPGLGDRRRLRGHGSGSRHGRHELDGARHGRRVDGGLQATIRFGGLEVGTVGGGTTLPSARDWLASIDCAGTGKVYRFAQIVAAAALASRSAPPLRWRRPAARTSSRRTTSAEDSDEAAVIALVFRYEVRDPEEFERVYGPEATGRSSSARAPATSAPSSCATSKSPTATS